MITKYKTVGVGTCCDRSEQASNTTKAELEPHRGAETLNAHVLQVHGAQHGVGRTKT